MIRYQFLHLQKICPSLLIVYLKVLICCIYQIQITPFYNDQLMLLSFLYINLVLLFFIHTQNAYVKRFPQYIETGSIAIKMVGASVSGAQYLSTFDCLFNSAKNTINYSQALSLEKLSLDFNNMILSVKVIVTNQKNDKMSVQVSGLCGNNLNALTIRYLTVHPDIIPNINIAFFDQDYSSAAKPLEYPSSKLILNDNSLSFIASEMTAVVILQGFTIRSGSKAIDFSMISKLTDNSIQIVVDTSFTNQMDVSGITLSVILVKNVFTLDNMTGSFQTYLQNPCYNNCDSINSPTASFNSTTTFLGIRALKAIYNAFILVDSVKYNFNYNSNNNIYLNAVNGGYGFDVINFVFVICSSSAPYYYPPNNTCLNSCPSSYYANSSDPYICNLCSNSCLQCQNNSTYCTKCADNAYISSGSCLPCQPPCLNCTTLTKCKSCINNLYALYSNFSCVLCPNTTYAGSNSCLNCINILPYCLTCSNQTTCTSCNSQGILAANNTCYTCPNNTFSNTSACISCTNNCLTCTDPVTCTSCDNQHILTSNKTCDTCPNTTYPTLASCVTCTNNCATCSNSTYCTSCLNKYILTSSFTCYICPNTTYSNINVCLNCTNNCVTCTDATTCTSCDSQHILSSNSCLLCPNTTFPNATVCSNCSSNCAICTSHNYCTSCISNVYILTASNTCQPCSNSTYPNANVCLNCTNNCLTCTDAATCTSCDVTRILTVSRTCQICPNTSYPLANVCQTCINNCFTCFTATNCTSCVSYLFILDNNTCIPNCSLSDHCNKCHVQSSAIYCQSCEVGYAPVKGVCKVLCGDGIILLNQECDDNNTSNEDGCSASCMVEQYFSCQYSTNKSICYLSTLELKYSFSTKVETSNKILMHYRAAPNLPILSQINWSSGLSFINANIVVVKAYFDAAKGFLVIENQYNEDLSNKQISLSASFSSMSTLTSKISSQSLLQNIQPENNLSVEFYSPIDYTLSILTKFASIFLACFSLLMLLFGYFGGKLIVLEHIAVLQVTCISLITIHDGSPTFQGLRYLKFSLGSIPMSSYDYSINIGRQYKGASYSLNPFFTYGLSFTLIFLPIIVSIILKLLSHTLCKDNKLVMKIWPLILGQNSYYTLVFSLYGIFSQLVFSFVIVMGNPSAFIGLIITVLYLLLTLTYCYFLNKKWKFFGQFKTKFQRYNICSYFYTFIVLQRFLSCMVIVLLKNMRYGLAFQILIIGGELLFIVIRKVYNSRGYIRPSINLIITLVILIGMLCCNVFPSKVMKLYIPLLIVILLGIITFLNSYYFITQLKEMYFPNTQTTIDSTKIDDSQIFIDKMFKYQGPESLEEKLRFQYQDFRKKIIENNDYNSQLFRPSNILLETPNLKKQKLDQQWDDYANISKTYTRTLLKQQIKQLSRGPYFEEIDNEQQ